MYAVIFRAVAGELDEQYAKAIGRMKELAFNEYNCVEFFSVSEGKQRVAISYWKSEEDIHRWKQNSEHLHSQAMGQEKWYESYSVEVVEVRRSYSHDSNEK